MRDALDGETEYDPALLVTFDLDPFSYTGAARFSQGFFDTAASLGHPVTAMIQETYSTRSQEGYAAGVMDCQFAESRARAMGWSGPIDYVVSDGNGADRWDASGYGRGISDTATLPIFGYGANGVLDSFLAGVLAGAGARLLVRGTDGQGGRHVPETWGPTNLIGQVVGPSPVPATDLNHVHADYTTPAPAPGAVPQEDTVHLVQYLGDPEPRRFFRVFEFGDKVYREEISNDQAHAYVAAGMVPFKNGFPDVPILDAPTFTEFADIPAGGLPAPGSGGAPIDIGAIATAAATATVDLLASRVAS